MKKTILAGLFCGSVVGAAVILKKERVIVEEIKVTQLNEKDDTPAK